MTPDGAELARALRAFKRRFEDANRTPDGVTAQEISRARLDRFRANTDRLKGDNLGRGTYGPLTFRLICWWVFGLFFVLLLQGFMAAEPWTYTFADGAVLTFSFRLADSVILTLLGATTATIIGLLATVMGYFFPKSQPTLDDGLGRPGAGEVEESKDEADSSAEQQ